MNTRILAILRIPIVRMPSWAIPYIVSMSTGYFIMHCIVILSVLQVNLIYSTIYNEISDCGMPPPGLHVCPILVRSNNVYGAWDEVAASNPIELPLAPKSLPSGAGFFWHPSFGVCQAVLLGT
jgi:hypothetical protein